MVILKSWLSYNEQHNDIPEYLLRISNGYVGQEEIIDIGYDFSYNDYKKYKNGDLPYQDENDFMEVSVDTRGISWEIEDDQLHVYTSYVGGDSFIDIDVDYDYNEDELKDMVIDEIGIEWEIIPNKEHPMYKVRLKTDVFNI